MKKIIMTSLVAIFAVGAAHAVGTVGTVTNITVGSNTVVASQKYVDRMINQQVDAEQTHRKSADGDLQFTGTAAAATNITDAINLVSTAAGSIDNKQDKSLDATAASGNIALWGAGGQTVTGKALQGAITATSQIATGQVASSDLVKSYSDLSLGNATTQGEKTVDAVTDSDLRAVTSNAVYDAIASTTTGAIEDITASVTGTDVTGTGAMNNGVLTFNDVTINDGAVTTAKILDGTITTTDINSANIGQTISATSTNTELATGLAVYNALSAVSMSAETCVAPNILVGDPLDPTHFICKSVVE